MTSSPRLGDDERNPAPVDVDALMTDIRRRVAEKRAKGIYTVDALAANALDDTAPLAPEELERLRDLAVQRVDLAVAASTKPLVGPAIRFAKRRLTRAVSQPLFAMAAHASQFNAGLLGYVARTGREAAALRRDLDVANAAAHDASTRAEVLAGALADAERRLMETERQLAAIGGEALHERVSRLERSGLDTPAIEVTARASKPSPQGLLGLVIESRDWSDEDAERWRDALGALEGTVLHVGCGSGRALDVLGPDGRGVDDDPELVAAGNREGRSVTCANPVEYVASLAPGTLAGALVTGVVERLDGASLEALVTGAAAALGDDAPLLVEALDPEIDGVVSSEIWRDPRAQRPLHPDAVVALLEAAGMTVTGVERHDTPGRYAVRATA